MIRLEPTHFQLRVNLGRTHVEPTVKSNPVENETLLSTSQLNTRSIPAVNPPLPNFGIWIFRQSLPGCILEGLTTKPTPIGTSNKGYWISWLPCPGWRDSSMCAERPSTWMIDFPPVITWLGQLPVPYTVLLSEVLISSFVVVRLSWPVVWQSVQPMITGGSTPPSFDRSSVSFSALNDRSMTPTLPVGVLVGISEVKDGVSARRARRSCRRREYVSLVYPYSKAKLNEVSCHSFWVTSMCNAWFPLSLTDSTLDAWLAWTKHF